MAVVIGVVVAVAGVVVVGIGVVLLLLVVVMGLEEGYTLSIILSNNKLAN